MIGSKIFSIQSDHDSDHRSTAIICCAHGSRHPHSSAMTEYIVTALTEYSGYPVRSAYLDFHERTLPRVVQELEEQGYRRVIVVPLLFTRAYHATVDLPQILQETEEYLSSQRSADNDNTDSTQPIKILLADPVGCGEDMAEVITEHVHRTVDMSGLTQLILYSVGSSVRGANEDIAHLGSLIEQNINRDLPYKLRVTSMVATGSMTQRVRGEVGAVAVRDYCQRHGGRVGIIPLFFSPGLLLDQIAGIVPVRHCAPPLGTSVVPVIAQRVEQLCAEQTVAASSGLSSSRKRRAKRGIQENKQRSTRGSVLLSS